MNLNKVSVKMSWLMRHCQEPLYIRLDGGWTEVKTILSVLNISLFATSNNTTQQLPFLLQRLLLIISNTPLR